VRSGFVRDAFERAQIQLRPQPHRIHPALPLAEKIRFGVAQRFERCDKVSLSVRVLICKALNYGPWGSCIEFFSQRLSRWDRSFQLSPAPVFPSSRLSLLPSFPTHVQIENLRALGPTCPRSPSQGARTIGAPSVRYVHRPSTGHFTAGCGSTPLRQTLPCRCCSASICGRAWRG
jgi:hypothetical protein